MPPKRTNKKLAKEHGLGESDVADAREAFNLVANDDGETMPVSATLNAMSAIGLDPSPEESKHITAHLKSLVAAEDSEDVTFDMFLGLVALKMSSRDRVSEVDKAFALFDPNETGRITIHDLRRIAESLGETCKDEELADMLDVAGSNISQGIDKAQFEEVMSRAGIW